MCGCERRLTLWCVVQLQVNQIKLDALDHAVHNILGNETLWRPGDNVIARIPCCLCLLHEAAEGVNELNVISILISRTVLDIKVEAINCCWHELPLSIRPWKRVERTRIVAIVPWTKGEPQVAGEITCTGGESVLVCRTTQGQKNLDSFALW